MACIVHTTVLALNNLSFTNLTKPNLSPLLTPFLLFSLLGITKSIGKL